MRALKFLVLLFVFAPSIALAAAPRTWQELVDGLVALMNGGVAVLVALAIALYFYGVSAHILDFSGEHGTKTRQSYFLWGIIVIFVMVSVWGILRLLQNTLFGSSAAAAGPTTSSQCLFGNC